MSKQEHLKFDEEILIIDEKIELRKWTFIEFGYESLNSKIFLKFNNKFKLSSHAGLLWPHRGRVGSDIFMASRTHLWPSRTPKNLPRPSGRGFYNTFPKISVGRDNSTTQRCFFVAMRP